MSCVQCNAWLRTCYCRYCCPSSQTFLIVDLQLWVIQLEMEAYDEYIKQSKRSFLRFFLMIFETKLFCWKFWDLVKILKFQLFTKVLPIWNYCYFLHIKWKFMMRSLNNLDSVSFCKILNNDFLNLFWLIIFLTYFLWYFTNQHF